MIEGSKRQRFKGAKFFLDKVIMFVQDSVKPETQQSNNLNLKIQQSNSPTI